MVPRGISSLACCALIVTLAGCSMPIRQYDLNDQAMPCERANQNAYATLQAMGFAVTAFDPAVPGRAGTMHATRQDRGANQDVTVTIDCHGSLADISASEDGRILNQVEFKRGFNLAFTAVAKQTGIDVTAAKEEAARPLAEKRHQGLQVVLTPVRGVGSKLDFDLDLSAGNVLPVLVTINNVTTRSYTLDPSDVVLVQRDGTRVPPLAVGEAARRVADAAGQHADSDRAPPDRDAVMQRLATQLLTAHSVASNQTVKGYLYFPLALYVKGRLVLEDTATEESEGFMVEFQ